MPPITAKPLRHRRNRHPPRTSAVKQTGRGGRFFSLTQLNHARLTIIAVWLTFALHGLGLMLLFRPLSGLLDGSPIIEQDWGLHFHHLRSLKTFWDQDRTWTGYDPSFMAGYPVNTIQDLSIKFFEILALGLSTLALSPVHWFKISAALGMMSVPWLMYFSGRNFFATELSRHLGAFAAAALGTIYWWNSLPREMFFYGMIGFPLAAYASVWGVSLVYRIAAHAHGITAAHLGWLFFALVILPLHVQSLLIILPACLVLFLVAPKFVTRNLILWLVGAGSLSLLANWFWILPAVAHRGDDASLAIVNQLPLFASADPLTFAIDYFGSRGYWTFRPSFLEKGFRLALLVLGAVGVRKLSRSEQRPLGLMLAYVIAGLFLLSYFGALFTLVRAWQPLRFKICYDLFLVIGAAFTISRQLQSGDVTIPRFMPMVMG